jgi:creatinine amidohydrolase
LEGTLANLVRAGFKMVVAHGHGPSTNQFNQHLASWESKFGMKLLTCWFENNNAENGIMCDHAAMNETSLVMHYFPELVKMNQLPIDTAQELRGVAGKDPRKFASPELGREIVEQNLERMKVLIKNELGNL